MDNDGFLTLLTKLKNVFKTDMYIIENLYCIGGEESESKNVGTNICILPFETCVYLQDKFGKHNQVIYIPNIANAKKFYNTAQEYLYFKTNIDALTKKELLNRSKILNDKIRKVSTWKSFNFTSEEIKALFTDKEGIILFSDDKELPEVYVSKSIYPMITEKNIANLYYSPTKEDKKNNIYGFITSFDTKFFQLYSLINYIDIKK